MKPNGTDDASCPSTIIMFSNKGISGFARILSKMISEQQVNLPLYYQVQQR